MSDFNENQDLLLETVSDCQKKVFSIKTGISLTWRTFPNILTPIVLRPSDFTLKLFTSESLNNKHTDDFFLFKSKSPPLFFKHLNLTVFRELKLALSKTETIEEDHRVGKGRKI